MTNIHENPRSMFAETGKKYGWRTEGDTKRCEYCGSLDPSSVIRLLKTNGTAYSGSDWKYGWPHKFYIGPGKFYSAHLCDATAEEFTELAGLIHQYLGITFTLDAEKLMYSSPGTQSFYGYQQYGTIGTPEKIGTVTIKEQTS